MRKTFSTILLVGLLTTLFGLSACSGEDVIVTAYGEKITAKDLPNEKIDDVLEMASVIELRVWEQQMQKYGVSISDREIENVIRSRHSGMPSDQFEKILQDKRSYKVSYLKEKLKTKMCESPAGSALIEKGISNTFANNKEKLANASAAELESFTARLRKDYCMKFFLQEAVQSLNNDIRIIDQRFSRSLDYISFNKLWKTYSTLPE